MTWEISSLFLLRETKETISFNCNLRFRVLIHSTNTYLSGIIHRNYKKKKKGTIREHTAY